MRIGRRQFLASALVAPAALTRRGWLDDRGAVVLDKGFGRATKEGDGLFITIADASKGPQCLSNGGVLAGRDGVLIVEGHMQREGAMLELELARQVSSKPIRGAVNTHYHLDHTFGNIAYQEAGLPIIAQDTALALMKSKYGALQGADKAPLLAPFEARVAAAKSEVEKARATGTVQAMQWMFGAIDQVQLAYPSELVSASQSPRRIDLGGLTAVLECHHAHTPGDLIVRVPERDVAFVGDILFVGQYPVSFDGDMLEWREVIRSLANESQGMRLVPGHGPICRPEAARVFGDLLDDLRHHAETMKKAGASETEAVARYEPPTAFKDYDVWAWDLTIDPAIRGFYEGLAR
jgi:glyoxylase-like metal-dependent hydrolase (beta-lactamase superfamily II)